MCISAGGSKSSRMKFAIIAIVAIAIVLYIVVRR